MYPTSVCLTTCRKVTWFESSVLHHSQPFGTGSKQSDSEYKDLIHLTVPYYKERGLILIIKKIIPLSI